jgi:hypothetical protein
MSAPLMPPLFCVMFSARVARSDDSELRDVIASSVKQGLRF